MNTKVTRWPYLAAGVLMMLFAGIIYAWSILKAPLAAEFGWNSAALGLNYTITLSIFCLGGVLGGILINKLPPRIVLIISGISVFAGFAITSMLQGNLYMLYVAYGVLAGLGIGVAYNAIISTVTSWYPDKRNTASGIMMMGFGASTLVLGSVAGSLINSIGWRTTYLALGVAVLAVFVLGSFFMKKPGANVKLPMPKVNKRSNEVTQDYSPMEMLKRISFWKFFIYAIFLIAIGQCVISFAKDVAMSVGAGESLAILLVGVLSVCNGLSRVITGILYDKIGRKPTMLIAGTLAITAPTLMFLAVTAHSIPLMVAGLCAIGLAFGTMPPTTSGFMGSFYGQKYFPLNFGIVGISTIPASIVATVAGAMVSASGSYNSVFIMLIVFGVLDFLLVLSIKKP